LENQEQVAWVNYPGLQSSKYELAKRYLQKGQNGLVTLLKGGFEAAKK
jgi:O-acetylhomoserine (thiol)-lyase